jgi:hypothetical protein
VQFWEEVRVDPWASAPPSSNVELPTYKVALPGLIADGSRTARNAFTVKRLISCQLFFFFFVSLHSSHC